MKGQDQNTEEVMLTAARKVFQQKGFEGTTLQAIAEEAGTTKSMVNYYFRSKEKLFEAIFKMEFREFFGGLREVITSESLSLKEKIARVVELDTEKMIRIPSLPLFILSEVNRNPAILGALLTQIDPGPALAVLNAQIAREVAAGTIRPISAPELFINIQALTIFPFVARPMATQLMNMPNEAYFAMLQARKDSVVEFVWNAIKV